MIRVVLLGRTGNNLFQYALGRVLAERHGVPLVLDGSWFNAEGWTEVSHFLRLPLQAKVVRRWSVATRMLRKLTGKHYWEYRGVPVLRESTGDQSFDARLLNAPADCLLFGYFQSSLYFRGIEEKLRDELRLLIAAAVHPPADVREALSAPGAVAVHVRRSDFLAHPEFQVCDDAYYLRAMDRMRGCVPTVRFLVFSDDPAWCRERFRGPDQQVLDSHGSAANPLHDLHLMGLASHHIIANSSYSWWAAWLGKKPGQIVLCPPRWFSQGIRAPIGEKLCTGWETVG